MGSTKKYTILINAGLLVLLFALSVSVRWENLNRPFGAHHEWLTAHTLITLEVWDERGISNCHWSPIYSYSNAGDVNVGGLGGITDSKGDAYYVSYPPLGFYAPYFFMQLTGGDVTIKKMTAFSLGVHFVAAFFIWLLMYVIYNKNPREEFFRPAFIACAIYLFSAATLWFHSNIYFVDMLVQLFWIVEVYLLVRIVKNPSNKWLWLWIGVLNFAAVYTEWIGVFIAAIAFITTVILFWKQRKFLVPAIIAVTTVLPIAMTIYSYSSIEGFETLKQVSMAKYEFRSGHNVEDTSHGIQSGEAFKTFNKKYNDGYQPILELFKYLGLLFLAVLIFRKFKQFFTRLEGLALLFILLSVLMHHATFFNFTVGHDFSMLKTGFLFSILAGVLCYKIVHLVEERWPKWQMVAVIPIVALLGWKLSDSVGSYYKQNDPKNPKLIHQILGNTIREQAEDDEMVFTGRWLGSPQTVWYAKRNLHEIEKVDEDTPAVFLLQMGYKDQSKAVFFKVLSQVDVDEPKRYTSED
jgi:4-amino-4-deoxy-L-arabinose transferase-like glycosyltransferase